MSVSGFLNRHMKSIVYWAGGSICLLGSLSDAFRYWEQSIERLAVDACRRNGGVALTARDGVVSCAPRTTPTGRPQ